jgi:hypothetical protein
MAGILSVAVRWINYDISIGWSFLTRRGSDSGSAYIFLDLNFDTDGDGIPNGEDLDDDGDGMTDVFENTYLGLNPLDLMDAGEDPDNDGLTNLEEFNKDPGLDPNDPDTDGDGIDDGLDNVPLISSNNCTGGTAADAIFTDVVTTDVTCAAQKSITVNPPAEVQGSGHLWLIAPSITVIRPFRSGQLTIISADPCAACP